MTRGNLRDLVHPLADPSRREHAAQTLAGRLGALRVLLYVKDPELDVMLPAAGMPKTLAGGPLWRAFLRRCLSEQRPTGDVDLPLGTTVPACALAEGGAALVLLGGAPDAGNLDAIALELPLLAAVLNAQEALRVERGDAAEARESAARAQTLALALDAARAASAELNQQLRREHERKDEFLAMLAHELRNPLSPLVNAIELLRRGPAAGDAGAARHLEVMTRQLHQLTRLVDDLLDVSRVSRGLIELRREPVRLEDILDDALDAVRPALEARGHAVLRRAHAADVTVNGDRVRLTQVFVNLFGNAAKYMDPGGALTVSVIPDQRRVSVVVQDTGIGIPADMLSRVFDMFTQVPAALDRAQGGLGIGLTLVRRLVELHGGHVTAHSRGTGHGSTFTVSLPRVHVPAAPVTAPRSTGPAAAARAPRVLVVDDNVDAGDTLAEVLGCMGAATRVVRDGLAALSLVPTFDPDLVLLDIGLPGIDGYETARRLRQLPASRARLVALTGYGSQQDRERALAAGFDDHVVKPLAPDATQRLLDDLAAMSL